MFGYITPCKMELKIKDYEKFKSYYCGLCHEIKNNFGNIPRLSLNFDMTFIAVLFDALDAEKTAYEPFKCILHPSKRRIKVCNSNAVKYAAFLNISLFYYKLLDDVYDDSSIKAKLLSKLFKKSNNKFTKDFPFINDKIKEELNNLRELESSKNSNIDEIAEPFARLTGFLFQNYPYKLSNDSFELRESLYTLGYNIGKWIYIIDAVDDLKKDMDSNKYNALNVSMNKDNDNFDIFFNKQKERFKFLLVSCSSKCVDTLNNINFVKDSEIVKNILFYGIMEKNEQILLKYTNDNKSN